MKIFHTFFLTATALVPFLSFAAAYNTNIPVGHVYTPAGFDSNDNIEVAVTGYLPSLCYKAPRSTVTVKDGKISVSMQASRTDTGLAFCTLIKIPYIEYIKVGVLDKGKYSIAVNELSPWEKFSSINIAETSSNSVDDVVYANVDSVERVQDTRTVLLKGYNPSDCFELKEIVVKDNGSDTYSILPKMKQVRAQCPMKMIPFTYEVEIPQTLDQAKVLLHVRVMDGRSVNAFFNNRPNLDFDL